MIMEIVNVIRTAQHHELTRGQWHQAVGRFLYLQAVSRLKRQHVLFDFVGDLRLFGGAGLRGANGNYYYGLMEFRDMSFLGHYLRSEDLFIDVGANIGAFSILAAGIAGSRVVAFEPVQSTVDILTRNCDANRLTEVIEIRKCCVSDFVGHVQFTINLDVLNHAVNEQHEQAETIEVPVSTLDQQLSGEMPKLIKIDTEGFDAEAIYGAIGTLGGSRAMSLIVEFNEAQGQRSSDEAISILQQFGFLLVDYDPFKRLLTKISPGDRRSNNFIFVRDMDDAIERVGSAEQIKTWNGIIL